VRASEEDTVRVLVVESDRHTADRAIADLRAAGHEVARCHESGAPAFPCNALCDGGNCPLDSGGSVDVLLDYRAHPHPRPTPFEDGVSCALRHQIPVVVAGTSALNPFDRWSASLAADDSVVDACERAASARIESLGAVALAKVRQLLSDEPAVADAADVSVTRNAGTLQAVVLLPECADELDAALAVGVAGAIRTRDRWTPRVDVCVRRLPSTTGRDFRHDSADRRP
jgi:hypothetical protein